MRIWQQMSARASSAQQTGGRKKHVPPTDGKQNAAAPEVLLAITWLAPLLQYRNDPPSCPRVVQTIITTSGG